MYGNGMNNPFMMSNMSYSPIMEGNSMMRSAPIMGNAAMMGNNAMMGGASRGGISSLLGGRGSGGIKGIFTGLKSLNFGNLLNNASKALGVVNQAIPIVKEVGPMVGNMKQMLKIASIFKDETDTSNVRKQTNTESTKESTNKENITSSKINNIKDGDTNTNSTTINTISNENEPNFFL